jgi:hypothetical protein
MGDEQQLKSRRRHKEEYMLYDKPLPFRERLAWVWSMVTPFSFSQ